MASSVPNVKPDGFHVWVDNPDAKVSIIFVQGLDAHPYYTWLWQRPLASSSKLKVGVGSSNDSKRECFWITELLPRHLPNAHIATYAYQTRWRCKDFATGLRECGDRLLQYVELDWMPNNGGRPIILIGHSFGGLVMQQALITANHGTVHQPFREAVSGIMFLGVPMQGSTLASVGSWVERMMNSSAGLMKTLKRDSPELRGLLSDFHAAYCHLPITCFTEHKKSLYGPLEIQTVTDNSSTILGRAEVFLDTDHSGLNKFSGDEDKDENFHRFIVKLKQYANFVIGAAAQRQGEKLALANLHV
ncbi:hypothetical protein K461DRAFT_69039 [Myriangium duriaei CBS 260.36]|uniref:AB hydrolase-1 domain-containing protein n=1 Tax=Myriangium duriaei CBS 260.36 TaxID=1168546 RepID=A0A9P4MHR1_9PEZI|nr:hypothetical protein K461DRAFT_69039 [Myriangium duriaei CBS 260.36]